MILKIYATGVLINLGILGCVLGVSALRKKERRLRFQKGTYIISTMTIMGFVALSLLSTLYLLHELSILVGEDLVRIGSKKKMYCIYMIGKMLEFKYNKYTFAYYMSAHVLEGTRKAKSVYRKIKIYDNYGGISYYYRDVVLRYQRIKRAR
ncbi:MAG: hypothetical protein ACRDCW_06750 [Sarcina sp.]